MLLQAYDLCDVMILRGQQPNIITYTILMNGYCLNNKVNEARNLFDMVIERGIVPDVWSYNILIKGYCKINRVDEAMNLRKNMFLKNIVLNIVTYNSLVDGLCKVGRISSAWEIVNEMHYCGQPFPDLNTYNILLDFVCNNQHLDETIALFKSLIFERNFVHTILISGYCKNKRFDEAVKPFQYMCSKNLDPNIETYNILLHALCDRQQLGMAIILLNQVVDDDICPNLYTYKILIHEDMLYATRYAIPKLHRFLLLTSNLLAFMPYAHRTSLCLLHSQPLPSRDA
ncbi:hypothetical protein Ahy_B08g093271 [Arachis hypogaea]|uniref:Pentatricopeptide repeat-containing protein n=1 Tax=Arachis hypogaea TaxID=3818 RepID=A0A444Y5R5_ARAHY|nr:hypothetical protein Ahy_B08g093271 [Arachis hypogaea]